MSGRASRDTAPGHDAAPRYDGAPRYEATGYDPGHLGGGAV